jgi:molybdenum cofactor cytidylyltransferase
MKKISAVILAAGQSRRMGQPKMLLPWGNTTVLGQVVAVLAESLKTDARADLEAGKRNIFELIVVTGGGREAVEAEVARLAEKFPLRCVYNPAHESGEMLSSLQCGLMATSPEAESALIGLGDQPQLSLDSARKVVSAFESSDARLIVPSYNLRRGHPWLVQRSLWGKILSLKAPETLRNFLNSHAGEILYMEADQTILKDLDTPEDYRREKP